MFITCSRFENLKERSMDAMQPTGRANREAGDGRVSGYSAGSLSSLLSVVMLILAILSTGLTGVMAQEGSRSSGMRQADPAQVFDDRRAEVVFPNGRVVVAEIADTPYRMQYGYMFRKKVGVGEGMIFVYQAAGFPSIWMKNTLVPLDLVWLDADFKVAHVERAVPPCRKDPCPSYGSMRKANYVLEVQGGSIAPDQLALGDRLSVSFPRPE